jgi:hypothetical protein
MSMERQFDFSIYILGYFFNLDIWFLWLLWFWLCSTFEDSIFKKGYIFPLDGSMNNYVWSGKVSLQW